MEELTPGTLIAVFEEMFGPLVFWAMALAAIAITLAYLYVLIRDHSVSWRKFLLAQLSMPVGFVGAIWFVQRVTNSTMADLGGPVDWLLVLGIGLMGAIGLAILVYTLQSLIWRPRRASAAADAQA
jgi:hypothetical protein